jgi:Tfp pilus assembly protein PilX
LLPKEEKNVVLIVVLFLVVVVSLFVLTFLVLFSQKRSLFVGISVRSSWFS